jgi:hypothetical protein
MFRELSEEGYNFELLLDAYLIDREVVLAAVNKTGFALQFASEALRCDREIVLAAALTTNGLAIYYASEALRNDIDIALVAVGLDRCVLNHLSDALKNDREVVVAALIGDGTALEYAAEVFKNDRDIVMLAAREDRRALKYASEALQNDRIFIFSIFMKSMFRKFRWPRLVKTIMQFERDDAAFARAFEPCNIKWIVNDNFLLGGDEVGPQPSPLWTAITNKKRNLT